MKNNSTNNVKTQPEQLQITKEKPIFDLEFLDHIQTLKYMGQENIPFIALDKALQELSYLKSKRSDISNEIKKRIDQLSKLYENTIIKTDTMIGDVQVIIQFIVSQHEDKFKLDENKDGVTLRNKHFEYGDIEIKESKKIKIKLHKPKQSTSSDVGNKGESQCQ